ncbi:MAG: Gar1/Naf1 family protein [Halobacteriales archaeon]
MRRVGTVVGTAQGLLVVRSADRSHPDVGAMVVDEQLDEVGEVVDVFGPVEQPYVSISPADSTHPPTLLEDPVYER